MMTEEGNKTQPGINVTVTPEVTEIVPGFTGPTAIFAFLGVLLLVSKMKKKI